MNAWRDLWNLTIQNVFPNLDLTFQTSIYFTYVIYLAVLRKTLSFLLYERAYKELWRWDDIKNI